ncbi:MAG TPA: ABC transporter permease [Candidatus Saccharimonadales bacterium]|nr:ABC transporter permease [Candidatus Saccharimonadales bacterium]
MPGIARALVWKEWREQRPVALTGLAVATALPFFLVAGAAGMKGRFDLVSVSDALPAFAALLIWPIFAVACGATTLANEIGEGTLGFLLSRPVSRARVWLIKVAVGLASVFAVIAGSMIVAWLFAMLAGSPGISRLFSFLFRGSIGSLPFGAALAGGVLLLFSSAVFFSTFVGRAMTAAAAGLGGAAAVLAGIFIIWSRMDLIPRLEPDLLAADIVLASVVILGASLFLFARGEMLRGAGARRRAALVSLVAIGGIVTTGMPLLYSQARLSPATAVLHDAVVSPRGDTIAVTAARSDGSSSQVWLVHPDGSGFERLTGRLTGSPYFSPDGRSVAYLSARGAFGLSAGHASLHVVSTDGSDDREIVSGLPLGLFLQRSGFSAFQIAFSPDGSQVAFLSTNILHVVPVQGGPSLSLRLRQTPVAGGRFLGWRKDGSELILVSGLWKQDSPATVAAVEPRSGTVRTVYQAPGRTLRFWPVPIPSRGLDRVPLLLGSRANWREPVQLVLLDLADGSAKDITDEACVPATALSDDGRTLAYTTCSGDKETGYVSRIHRFDLETSKDVVAAEVAGRIWTLFMGPTPDQIAVEGTTEKEPRTHALLLGPDGSMRDLGIGVSAIGWTAGRRLIVGSGESGYPWNGLSVVDPETGATRPIYP